MQIRIIYISRVGFISGEILISRITSLASNITVAELFMAGQRVAARTYIFLPIYCEVAVVYLLFCTVITKLQAVLEHRLNARGFQ